MFWWCLSDDQERDDGLRGDEERRLFAADQEPGKDGKAGCAEN